MIGKQLDRLLHPPAIVIDDERVTYRRQLSEARARQHERDLEADAYLDNAFWGVPYKSIFDEYPGLLDEVCRVRRTKK